jgi:soluble lytic murein transglycosylase-like protein
MPEAHHVHRKVEKEENIQRLPGFRGLLMIISPVDSKREQSSRVYPGNDRLPMGNAFASMLEASVKKGISAAAPSEKAEFAADILRLEMMKSAVSLADPVPETASSAVSNALKAALTNYVGGSQKVDSPIPESSSHSVSEVSPATHQPPPSAVDTSPVTGRSEVPYDPIIKAAARRYGVEEGLIKAVIKMESNFNPKAVSHTGARGLMQLMPSTASGLGVKDSFDPEQNIMAGTRFLRELLDKYGGDLDATLAAYNWGPGNVDRNRGAFLPRETREYLVKVKKYYTQFVG